MGGTNVTATLVCTECNNWGGSSLDVHLKNRLEAEDFFQGISDKPQRSWIKVGDFKARADWSFRHGERPECDLQMHRKNTNPAEVEGIQRAFQKCRETADGMSFKLTVELGFNPWRSHVGLLRMAFLLAFRQFGYAYALNGCAALVRKQIQAPKERILPDVFCMAYEKPPVEGTEILIVKEPAELRAFLVNMRLRTKKRTVYNGVFLPHPWDEEASIYGKLKKSKEANMFSEKFSRFCGNKVNLSDPNHLMAVFEIWKECVED
jgi:hypothetical protein